ncbi:MAG TPA: hypothetical protein PKL27_09425 [Nitrosomonas sp.]|nr:hypothetical protein [Nitrosomonas sp.]HNK88473.1 hypothetical protein [Nitrosomonas sp.]
MDIAILNLEHWLKQFRRNNPKSIEPLANAAQHAIDEYNKNKKIREDMVRYDAFGEPYNLKGN